MAQISLSYIIYAATVHVLRSINQFNTTSKSCKVALIKWGESLFYLVPVNGDALSLCLLSRGCEKRV